jgi:D-cysteine desulfhydrase
MALMSLARFPRRRYTFGPTPLERLPRLSAQLGGGVNLFAKRDDLLGLAGGGSKARKLEFLVAEALELGADTLVTCGAVQSNHCRLTAAAAAREGLRCRLVLEERVPGTYDPLATGNNLLYDLLGVEAVRVVTPPAEPEAAMREVAAEVEAGGGRPYVIPGGGSSPLGALGYAACAAEILAQAFDQGVRLDHVVCASGSAGTHAGLLAGFAAASARLPVIGVSVRRPRGPQSAVVLALARATAELAESAAAVEEGDVEVLDGYVGPGYSLPTEGMVEAVRLLARLEGMLLDPVYTGKAMAGLVDLVRRGRFRPGANVLFVHTGGVPALYAYAGAFLAPRGEAAAAG